MRKPLDSPSVFATGAVFAIGVEVSGAGAGAEVHLRCSVFEGSPPLEVCACDKLAIGAGDKLAIGAGDKLAIGVPKYASIHPKCVVLNGLIEMVSITKSNLLQQMMCDSAQVRSSRVGQYLARFCLTWSKNW